MEGFLLGKVDVKMIEGFVCTFTFHIGRFGMSKNQKDVYKPLINVLIKRGSTNISRAHALVKNKKLVTSTYGNWRNFHNSRIHRNVICIRFKILKALFSNSRIQANETFFVKL